MKETNHKVKIKKIWCNGDVFKEEEDELFIGIPENVENKIGFIHVVLKNLKEDGYDIEVLEIQEYE